MVFISLRITRRTPAVDSVGVRKKMVKGAKPYILERPGSVLFCPLMPFIVLRYVFIS